MNAESLKEAIKRELPSLLREDPAFRTFVLELTQQEYAPRRQTEDWINETLAELRRDREAQTRKWEEQKAGRDRDREEQAKKWEDQRAERERDRAEQAKKWEDQRAERERDRAEQAKKWEDQRAEREREREQEAKKWEDQRAEREREREQEAKKWAVQEKRWEAQQAERERDREEQAAKWQENSAHFDRVHDEIMAQAKKLDRSIGALGARWGIQSETAFRNALAGILEENFGVQVINVNEFDDEGTVFGRPDQVELDVIIKNGTLLICELKSSVDKAGIYIFERKARFYEARHNRKAERLIVISPMVDAKARKVADKLGIELYTDSEDVDRL